MDDEKPVSWTARLPTATIAIRSELGFWRTNARAARDASSERLTLHRLRAVDSEDDALRPAEIGRLEPVHALAVLGQARGASRRLRGHEQDPKRRIGAGVDATEAGVGRAGIGRTERRDGDHEREKEPGH